MQYLVVILVLAATFGVCYLLDKLFHKLFRNKQEHQSGKAVHLNKKYGAAGILLTVLGIGAIFAGINGAEKVLLIGGCIVLITGICLIVYYLTFGIYYDTDTFLVSKFGKKGQTYRYSDIKAQQLLTSAGGVLVEVFLKDGKSITLQQTMDGAYTFLDYAFDAWCRQQGIVPESCEFHKPEESCWFPGVEER